MSRLRRSVYGRLDPDDYRQLQQEAAARSVSLTACIADCLREYFALRVEMASAVAAPGKSGERHTGLIHSILARTEERLAATLEARMTESNDKLDRLEIKLDRLVLVYLLHTPEVARELQASAVTSAQRRYANYRKFVKEQFARGDLAGAEAGGVEAGRINDARIAERRREQADG